MSRPWTPLEQHPAYLAAWRARMGDLEPPSPWGSHNGLIALVSRENLASPRDTPDIRWHISVRHEDRLPTWEEVVQTGHELRPGVVFVVGVPPRSWWINVHPDVLHLYEVKDPNLIDQWRAERRGHTPT